jgi:ABC-type transport system involved in multi-copper enzyme maturation permease subunit
MSQLPTLIAKEVLDSFLNYKMIVAFTITSALILLAMVMGAQNYVRLLREDHVARALQTRSLENQPSYGFLGVVGVRFHRPPTKLSAIATGLELKMGQAARVTIFSDPEIGGSNVGTSLILNLVEPLDLTLIVKVVFSLIALLLAHDVVSGEKELGTLRLCLANALPRDSFLLGKAIGRVLVLMLSLLLPLMLGLSVCQWLIPETRFNQDDYARFLLILGMYLLYTFVCFAAGLFISTLSSNTSTSLVTALLAWVLMTIILPSVSFSVGTRLYPIEPRYEVEARKDMILQSIQKEANQEALQWVSNNPGKRLDAQTIEAMNRKYFDRRANESKKVEEQYQRKLLTQLNLAMNLSRISPASCMSVAAMNLAGTGFMSQQQFSQVLDEYQRSFAEYINRKGRRSSSLASSPTAGLDVSDLPDLTYRPPPVERAVESALVDVFTLGVDLIVLFVAAYVMFLRYDVR